MTNSDALAIGVDGGASGVRALAVRRREDGFLEAAGTIARRHHEPFGAPVVVREDGVERPRESAEVDAARARVSAAAEVIAEAAGADRRIRLGICWPGRKTEDARGVDRMRNGPRDPHLLDELEREVAARGIEIAQPIAGLASDGVAGALGELWSVNGALRGVRDALYFAGGSGLAEAVLVAGRVRALDELTPPMPKAFETEAPRDGLWTILWDIADRELSVYEDMLAPGRWSRTAADRHPLLALRPGRHPLDWAEVARLEPRRFQSLLNGVASALVGYIEDRLRRLRDPAGIVPERAVVGARLGQLLARTDLRDSSGDRLRQGLERIGLSADFVHTSEMLEAPAFGAAALALGLENEDCPS